MNNNLGNLRDWGTVLNRLDEIVKSNQLDEYQDELVRILKYKKNWKLRETVLLYSRELHYPADNVIEAICEILIDYDVYLEARIIAADTLGVLANKIKYNPHENRSFNKESIIKKMNSTLELPQAPILVNAIKENLSKLAS